MNKELQSLKIPTGCKINKNEFTTYNPEIEYTEEKNLFYLWEDLLQIEFEHSHLIIDLGWYGEISSNDGEFRILVVENENWEEPLKLVNSKSQKIITSELDKILMEIKNTGKVKASA
ncbi:hypothetical protein [Winogradskyella flava]|uniref:hypothetical protein n=1 Tax=Winogradskyella flava TaxID=1884876 RepID=UPI00248F5AF1|nr:hypothetical protein [Winogradskyella flava]